MPQKITYGRSVKVWWSYTWRASILIFAVWLAVVLVLSASGIIPHRTGLPRPPPSPAQLRHQLRIFWALWPVAMLISAALGTAAMHWTLHTRWSDFELQALGEGD